MQLLNVALGGTLIQHLEDHTGGLGVFGSHPVTPLTGTAYADAVPETAMVPAYHHQAVDRLGTGLVASAHAPDGTVEALELPDRASLVLGVQWHPEMGQDTRVMAALVRAAGERASSALEPRRGVVGPANAGELNREPRPSPAPGAAARPAPGGGTAGSPVAQRHEPQLTGLRECGGVGGGRTGHGHRVRRRAASPPSGRGRPH